MHPAKVAKSIVGRSLRMHRSRDNHDWAIRRITVADAGNVLEQPIVSYTDETIYPVVSEINEYEAANIGQNVRAGDLRLIIDGFVTLDETTLLICDGQKCDIFRSPPVFNSELVQQRVVYVKRPEERTDV